MAAGGRPCDCGWPPADAQLRPGVRSSRVPAERDKRERRWRDCVGGGRPRDRGRQPAGAQLRLDVAPSRGPAERGRRGRKAVERRREGISPRGCRTCVGRPPAALQLWPDDRPGRVHWSGGQEERGGGVTARKVTVLVTAASCPQRCSSDRTCVWVACIGAGGGEREEVERQCGS